MAESRDPFDVYRSARARAFGRLGQLRERMDAWLAQHENEDPLDLSSLALLEGLNAERDAVIAELQQAEATLMEVLLTRRRTANRPA